MRLCLLLHSVESEVSPIKFRLRWTYLRSARLLQEHQPQLLKPGVGLSA